MSSDKNGPNSTFTFEDVDLSKRGFSRSSFEPLDKSSTKRFADSNHLSGQDITDSNSEEDDGEDNLYEAVDVPIKKYEPGNSLPTADSVRNFIDYRRESSPRNIYWCLLAFAQMIVILGLSIGVAKRRKASGLAPSTTTNTVFDEDKPLQTGEDSSSSDSETEYPSSDEEELFYLDLQEFLVGKGVDEDVFEEGGGPQYEGMIWLAAELDQLALSLPEQSDHDYDEKSYLLLTRYVMAVTKLSLNVDDTWYEELNFLSSLPVCEWNAMVEEADGTSRSKGLQCDDDGMPVYLNLANNGLNGEIPPELGLLATLTDLDLSSNDIEGTFPEELCSLEDLEMLDLDSNELEGFIPVCIGDMSELVVLSLSNNYFQGRLPIEMGNLESLEILILEDNELEGSEIIPIVGSLYFLRLLSVGGNSLTGFINPTMFEELELIQTVHLSDNEFEGEYNFFFEIPSLVSLDLSFNNMRQNLPEEIKFNANLRYLDLQSNGMIAGVIPNQIGNLVSLTYLSLSNNALTGDLPESIGGLGNLNSLFLANLPLLEEGPVPTAFDNLQALEELSLQNSCRTGVLPELAELEDLQFLDLARNDFSGFIPETWEDITDLRVLILSGNSDLTGDLPDFFEGFSSLEILLLDGTGLAGDLEFMCDAMNWESPDDIGIRVNCDDEEAFMECSCCTCCKEDEEMCSYNLLAELDEDWKSFLETTDGLSLYT